MKKLHIVALLVATLGTGCGLFYHKEVVRVPEPQVLTDPEVAEAARGAELIYTDGETNRTVKARFLDASDSTVIAVVGKGQAEIDPGRMSGARLELKASKLSAGTCIGSTCLGGIIGTVAGVLVGKSIYDDAADEGPGSCVEAFLWPLIIVVVLIAAVMIGLVVAGLVMLLVMLLGGIILPNIIGNPEVRKIQEKGANLRDLISRKSGAY